MRYCLELVLDSRYDEKKSRDIENMFKKVDEFARDLRKEVNEKGKYIGLHMTINNHMISMFDRVPRQRYYVLQDGSRFYDDMTGACLFKAKLIVKDFDLDAAKVARTQFIQHATNMDWVIRFVS